jgi:hypothetical protein
MSRLMQRNWRRIVRLDTRALCLASTMALGAPPAAPLADCAPRDISVVIAVPQVLLDQNTQQGIESDIATAVADAEKAFGESEIVGRIKHSVEYVNFDLGGPAADVVRELERGSSAASEGLRSLRAHADAVAAFLLLEEVDDRYCGGASVLRPQAKITPFGYVLRRCLGKGLTLAHELTHIFGANHQLTSPAYSDASHGYVDDDGAFRTLEDACEVDVQCLDRIPRLSDAAKKVEGAPRGSTDRANSAREFRSSICLLIKANK